MKRIWNLIIALALITTTFTGCSTSSGENETTATATLAQKTATEQTAASIAETAKTTEASAETSYPLTTDDVTLTMFATSNSNVTNVIGDLNHHQVYMTANDITGVTIDINTVPMESGDTQLSLLLASGDYPDIFRSASFPNGVSGALDEDIIIDLTDKVAQYAPYYTAILASDEQVSKDCRTDDGQVLGFSRITQQDGKYDISPGQGPMIRSDLLKEMNLDVPDTIDGLEKVLTAFKTEYELSDPLLLGNTVFSNGNALLGSFDVGQGMYQIDGTVYYGPLQQGFCDYLELMAKWVNAGIINPEFYNYEDNPNSPTNEALKTSGQAGMHFSSATLLDYYNKNSTLNIVAVPLPAGADRINHFGLDTFAVKGLCYTISSTCEYPELATQWCDFWYGKQGIILSNYGIEGATFEYDAEGTPHWTEFMTNNPDGLAVNICRQCYTTQTQHAISLMDIELEYMSDNAKAAIEVWDSTADQSYLMPNVTLTGEESITYSNIISDVDTLNDETWYKMILGEMSFDEWDNYIAQLKGLGIQEAIDTYQAALNRYNDR